MFWFPELFTLKKNWDFPSGPVVKTLPSNAVGEGPTLGRGAKIPHASQSKKNQNIKQKQYCITFNTDFKIVHIKKKILKRFTFYMRQHRFKLRKQTY